MCIRQCLQEKRKRQILNWKKKKNKTKNRRKKKKKKKKKKMMMMVLMMMMMIRGNKRKKGKKNMKEKAKKNKEKGKKNDCHNEFNSCSQPALASLQVEITHPSFLSLCCLIYVLVHVFSLPVYHVLQLQRYEPIVLVHYMFRRHSPSGTCVPH